MDLTFNHRLVTKPLIWLLIVLLAVQPFLLQPLTVEADENFSIENDKYQVEIGDHGEIFSFKLPNDVFDTEYFMNSENASFLNESELNLWGGQVMFAYRSDENEAWQEAWTSMSEDIRSVEKDDNAIIITYDGEASHDKGIKDFKVTQTFELVEDFVYWTIEVTNTSDKRIEIGDLGLPMPFNEQWVTADGLEETYEHRTLTKSFIGNNSSFISIGRPNGSGDSLMLIPDGSTGAGFEYQDRWKSEDHPTEPENLWANDDAKWIKGLNVYYVHSNHIKKTGKGYLENTSLFLEPGESKTYGFKFVRVSGEDDLKNKIYQNGLVDVTVVPSMTVPTDTEARFSLRTTKDINAIEPEYPEQTSLEFIEEKDDGHHIYKAQFEKLGQNNITVEYGDGERVVLQFYAIEPIKDALQRHSTFMVEKTQYDAPGEIYDKVFDDWMMHTQSLKGDFNGYWGWGDDWGYTKGQFLAEKNVQTPVEEEIIAVDEYLDVAIWNTLMKEHQEDYLVHDFLMPEPNDTPTYRGYAYPHIYNTYFSMYKISTLYPELIDYVEEPETYLLRAYNIMRTMYDGPVAYNWHTGVMGELTTPDIIQALEDEGFYSEAKNIKDKMVTKFDNFKNQKYPFGSEYNYDNTGEESVYMLAKMFDDEEIMQQINQKTRFARGWMPAWYYYSVPVTITGENWWNGQYSASLIGYAMDDWTRDHAQEPEVAQRLNWAGKIANVSHINSGQIDSNPENMGAVSWTYQSELGNHDALGHGGGPLLNGWRTMSGEADLGLWGAIHILSTDVSNDPLFGLIAYGGEVTEDSGNYTVVPKDGVSQRLNLITEDFGMELQRDKYDAATVAKTKDYLKFTLRNVTPENEHKTHIRLSGLASGSYEIKVDGDVVERVNAFNEETTITIPGISDETHEVEIVAAEPLSNTAPTVEVEEINEVTLPSAIQLKGTVDDDGLPSGEVTSTWKVIEGPEQKSVVIDTLNEAGTVASAKVAEAGEYVFELTTTDGELSSSETVTVTVHAAPPLPEVLTHYKFNETEGETVADASGSGNDATAKGEYQWKPGLFDHSISLGGNNGYIDLPDGIVDRVEDFTVSTWVKATDTSNYQRIFDFGDGGNSYMFLTHRAGGDRLTFTISTNGNQPGAEQSVTASSIPLNEWKHVAVTLSDTTAILYVDGKEVGRNDNITLNPSDLGTTTSNYIGRSQYSDPYYKGELDEFLMYSRALNPDEINELATIPLDGLESLEEVEVVTSLREAPTLPKSVTGVFEDGRNINLPVSWDEITPDQYEEEGEFVVEGTVEGTDLKAIANVTVRMEIKPYPELITRYNFDHIEDTTIEDISGTDHHGTIIGNLTPEENGYKGGALDFGGESGNYIDMGNSEELLPSNITISYWIKRTEQWDGEEILAWFKPEGNYAGDGLFITYNGNSSVVLVDGTAAFYVEENPNDFLPENEWTNVVVTFNSDTNEASIYKNGVKQEITVDGAPDSISANTDIKKIGVSGYGDGAQLQSSLDDFRIYNGSMTEKQVQKLYEGKDIVNVHPVELKTEAGTAPELPQEITVEYEDGTEGSVFVQWDEMDPSQYAEEGTYTITGQVDGTNLKATATLIIEGISLEAPEHLTAVEKQLSIDLSWSEVETASAYVVKRAEGGSNYETLATVDTLEFADRDVEPNVTYYYVVHAVDQNGEEGRSSEEVMAAISEDIPNDLGSALEDYIVTGDFPHPLSKQLINTYKQYQHHEESGRTKQAKKFLHKLLDQMDSKPHHITEEAKEVLTEIVLTKLEE